MNEVERKTLNLDDIDFQSFFQKKKSDERVLDDIEKLSTFPSREPEPEDQVNIKGPRSIIQKFKKLKKIERYPYAEMLEILIDTYVASKKREER